MWSCSLLPLGISGGWTICLGRPCTYQPPPPKPLNMENFYALHRPMTMLAIWKVAIA